MDIYSYRLLYAKGMTKRQKSSLKFFTETEKIKD